MLCIYPVDMLYCFAHESRTMYSGGVNRQEAQHVHGWESSLGCRHHVVSDPVVQWPRTPDSHSGDGGSTPLGVTKNNSVFYYEKGREDLFLTTFCFFEA